MKKIIIIIIIISIICVLFFISVWIESEQTTDIDEYYNYFAFNGLHNNDVFPTVLSVSATIEKFHYYYYNPFDPNYVSYLVLTCNDEDFRNETRRLHKLDSSDNYLIYGATDFKYPISAIFADRYGYLYALEYPEENKLIYVEISFFNDFCDIDYEKIIEPNHLPINFDANLK